MQLTMSPDFVKCHKGFQFRLITEQHFRITTNRLWLLCKQPPSAFQHFRTKSSQLFRQGDERMEVSPVVTSPSADKWRCKDIIITDCVHLFTFFHNPSGPETVLRK